jgi:imidazolonepropionase-like amidohydrolase
VKLIQNAKIYTVTGHILEKGMMLVDDNGKIAAIGTKLEVPSGSEVLDFVGKVILPGFVDAHSHVGIWGDGEGAAGYDGNEMPDPVNGKVNALDAANPLQRSFAGAREGGITTLQIVPGSGNPIGGLGFACKSAGTIIDDMVIKNPTGLKGALGENPKKAHGQGLKHAPSTRMGIAALIREYFRKAADYGQKKAEAEAKGKSFDIDMNLESGLKVLKKEIPFRVHAHRHDDIVTAVRLCEELDINYSIEHCTDGHLLADFLAEKKVHAQVGPGLSSRSKIETANFTDRNPAVLANAGVKVSLITDHPFLDSRYFMAYGAVSHKHGMSFEDTLKAMTINPAESIGVADRVGSLEVGKDADFIVLSGEPFTYTSVIEKTFIEGRCVWERPTY